MSHLMRRQLPAPNPAVHGVLTDTQMRRDLFKRRPRLRFHIISSRHDRPMQTRPHYCRLLRKGQEGISPWKATARTSPSGHWRSNPATCAQSSDQPVPVGEGAPHTGPAANLLVDALQRIRGGKYKSWSPALGTLSALIGRPFLVLATNLRWRAERTHTHLPKGHL